MHLPRDPHLDIISETPLHAVKGSVLDISASATPCRYRLVDCLSFKQDQVLRICETREFPDVRYSTISYVWRGVSIDSSHQDEMGIFTVNGAEDGDPISVDVMYQACTASLLHGANYLWLDKLCLMQTDRQDKAWQISRMYDIYRFCHLCLVIPGGIHRLVDLTEETAWIHRAWTLQEAIIPKSTLVLYSWTLGSGAWANGNLPPCNVLEVTPQRAAVSSIVDLLQGSIAGLYEGRFTRGDEWSAYPAIFRDTGRSRAAQFQLVSLIAAMNVKEPEARAQAIWRSAWMRTSSRPVDMVFSIMGLFGISLDSRAFHKDDRLGATIALARAILEKGDNVSWLGVSFHLPPCRQLSSFPEFPETKVEGGAFMDTNNGVVEVAELMIGYFDLAWWLSGVPTGTMDGSGYLTICARAAPIMTTGESKAYYEPVSDNMTVSSRLVASDGEIWRIADPDTLQRLDARRFIVFLGMQEPFHLPGMPRWHAGWSVRAIVLEEHEPDKFHRSSCFMLGDSFRFLIDSWDLGTFSIGGPLPPRSEKMG